MAPAANISPIISQPEKVMRKKIRIVRRLNLRIILCVSLVCELCNLNQIEISRVHFF